MRKSHRRLFAISFLMALYSFIFLPSAEADPRRIAFFVNGDQNCCADRMYKTMEAFQNEHIEVDYSAWNSLTAHNIGSNPSIDNCPNCPHGTDTDNFIRTATDYFNSLPDGTEVYLVGHSFGGDSVLRLVESYRISKIRFRLVAVLDAVSTFGIRSKINKIPSNVDYFFNRWQENAPWPTDFLSSGRIDCDAKDCNQENQNFSRHPNGDTRTTECEKYESCPGAGIKTGRNGLPFYYPGEKKTRLHHQFVPTDPYIEEQIVNITKQLAATSDIPRKIVGSCVTNDLSPPVSLRFHWGDYAPEITVIEPSRRNQYGETTLFRRFIYRNVIDEDMPPPPLFVEFDSDSTLGYQRKAYELRTWAIPIQLDQAVTAMANSGKFPANLCSRISEWYAFQSRDNGQTIDLNSIQKRW